MFPLDALEAWPRLYGPGGLLQYQLVVPFGGERVLELVIDGLRRTRVPCYLAVLKDFGPANGAPLSFPIAGWTLALDVPRTAPGLDPLLARFDQLVAEAGGRVYLAKDIRLNQEALEAMYPDIDRWRKLQAQADPDGVWQSDLALRTGLVAAHAQSTSATSASCASTSSHEPKWVIASRLSLQANSRPIDCCQASTSISGGGVGGIVGVWGAISTPAAPPMDAAPSLR